MKLREIQLNTINLAYQNALLPTEELEGKTNIFVGIGLWSKSHGLTAGLPIDVLTIIIAADQLRNQLAPDAGTIYIYVADNLALESRSNHLEIEEIDIIRKRDQTIHQINAICQWLQIDKVVIEDSSAFSDSVIYQEILQEVETKHATVSIPELTLEQTTENYLLKQTALIGFYQRKRNCAVKISWCYDEKTIPHEPTKIIGDGIKKKNFDELWFDAFYQLHLGESHPIGFVYTPAGLSLAVSSKNTSAPYFAKDQAQHPRILFGDSLETLQGNALTPGKIPRKISTGPSIKKGTVKKEAHVSEFHYQLPPKFKHLMLAILQELKENYGIKIESRKYESNTRIIIADLACVANLSNLLVNEESLDEEEADKVLYLDNPYVFFKELQIKNVQEVDNSFVNK